MLLPGRIDAQSLRQRPSKSLSAQRDTLDRNVPGTDSAFRGTKLWNCAAPGITGSGTGTWRQQWIREVSPPASVNMCSA